MLNNTLNANQVKDATGTALVFERKSNAARETVFANVSEAPAFQDRISIKHTEIGSGLKKRQRSVVRVDLTALSDVDNVTPVNTLAYVVVDTPIGAFTTKAIVKHALARLMSFIASDGSDSTIKFDSTGSGAASLVNGST